MDQLPGMGSVTSKIIQLHAGDNVVVCIQGLREGDLIPISGNMVKVRKGIDIGHKLANKNILRGEVIVKYGVPIGLATEDISIGEHVHTHNIKSNYIETYLL
jgi:hypothetical protein